VNQRRTADRKNGGLRYARFKKLHGDVGCAFVGLARFVNGHDIYVMNAPGGSRIILIAQQKFRIIEGSDK
jgi:hypothetical protein